MVGGYPSAIIEEKPIYETREHIVNKINELRATYGRPPVELADPLNCAGLTWSKRMWRLNICAHVDPVTKTQWWQRLEVCGGQVRVIGYEVVACQFTSIEDAIKGWMSSNVHNQALLDGRTKFVGVGVAGSAIRNGPRWYTIVLSG